MRVDVPQQAVMVVDQFPGKVGDGCGRYIIEEQFRHPLLEQRGFASLAATAQTIDSGRSPR